MNVPPSVKKRHAEKTFTIARGLERDVVLFTMLLTFLFKNPYRYFAIARSISGFHFTGNSFGRIRCMEELSNRHAMG
jgi:hypothetical protein